MSVHKELQSLASIKALIVSYESFTIINVGFPTKPIILASTKVLDVWSKYSIV